MAEEWEELAECRYRPDLSWFPSEDNGRGGNTSFEMQDKIALVKSICIDECPVRVACVALAMSTGASAGIWGGIHVTETKWKRMRKMFRSGDPDWETYYMAVTGSSGLLRQR